MHAESVHAAWRATRRSILLLSAAWLVDRSVGRLFARQAAPSVAELALRWPVHAASFRSRHYVVNATVILGSIPVLSKSRIGGAFLSCEEAAGSECAVTGLQFGAGSWPDRLKGFNRFGMTQELVRDRCGTILESVYSSLMTACGENSVAQARRAFLDTADRLHLTIAKGRSTLAGSTANIRHETGTANLSWIDCPKLFAQLDEGNAPVYLPVSESEGGRALPTFLYAVRRAIQNPQHTASFYAHNGQVYSLESQVRTDSKSGELAVTARTRRRGAQDYSEFKLWMGAGETDLPTRIEFRARSFLKLTLETDPNPSGPVFKRLLNNIPS